MKKMLLGAVGLSAVLASCGGGEHAYVPLSNLQLTGYTSNHPLATAYTDQNGNTYAAGTPLICDNWDTTLSISVTWQGGLQQLMAQLVGSTGDTDEGYINLAAADYSGSGTYTYTLSPEQAPLSLQRPGISPQDMPVTPVNTFIVKGLTSVHVQGTGAQGNQSDAGTSTTMIPVADCN